MLKIRRRGIVIVLVLMVISTLFILSAGFLSKKNSEQKAVQLARQKIQAREVALSGVETVRVKLLNDSNFPPANLNSNLDFFSYSEEILDLNGADEVGRYQVDCDRRWMSSPYSILRVTVTGQVGNDTNPVKHKLVAEFLLSPGLRGDLVNLVDEGDL